MSNLDVVQLRAFTVRSIDGPEPEAGGSGGADPFIARSSIRLSEFQTLMDRATHITEDINGAREATEADFPLRSCARSVTHGRLGLQTVWTRPRSQWQHLRRRRRQQHQYQQQRRQQHL